MSDREQQFNAAAIGEKFNRTCVRFDRLLTQGSNEDLNRIQQKLDRDLKKYQNDGILSVAFVGQYSAGKSTIISGLTGKRDIKIDADIATDRTTSYDWNGMKIIDTPGLFTERQDHDAITYDAINRSDLLVFCLTYMLFDSVTVENFKKLAYERGYRWKMMLLVNKMSDEAGEEEQKIANYRQSLAEALKPYSLDEFPVCFIDAKDYCEGVDTDDDFLVEISRFPTFIDTLNQFTQRRGSLARFDTPLRIALSYVDDAQLSFTRNSTEDSAFFEILNQLSRQIRNERSRLRTQVQTIVLRMSSAIAKEGTILATALSKEDKEEFERSSQQAESQVQFHSQKAQAEIEEVVRRSIDSLKQEIQGVFQGDLAQAFFDRLEVDRRVSTQNIHSGLRRDSNFDVEIVKRQIEMLQNIGEQVGVGIRKLATDGTTTVSQGFLSASNVAGSTLHHIVYDIGKFIGVDFKPWQAVHIAQGFSNVLMVAGPILGVVSLFMDFQAMEQEQEREQKLSEAHLEITSQFLKVAKDIESQMENQIREIESQIYGQIERQIALARQEQEEAIASSNIWMKELIEIRSDFQSILDQIANVSAEPLNL
jgi:hypothetical protein